MASATSTPLPGVSPVCHTRIQEKEDLRHLNDRLANYIQRVQELEAERTSMLALLEDQDEAKRGETERVRRLYEEELADVRSALDELAGERARLQVDHGSLCEDHRTLQTRAQKKEKDLVHAVAQWRAAEVALSSREAEVSKLLTEKRGMTDDLADLQGHVEHVEGTLADTKNQLTTEILRRVDMENQVQTLKEQLHLQRNISEQEMSAVQSRHESRLAEVVSGRQREFESKLAHMMQQLRQDHQAQLTQYKEEMERTFSSKLQITQEASVERTEELEATRLTMESLSTQFQQLQKHKTVLEGRIQDLERTLDRERDAWRQQMSQKDQELLSVRSQMSSQLEDYENLLDIKLALDMEISAYRKMLEVEEQRLHLSPSPSKPAAAPGAQERRTVRGRKRKLEGVSGSSPACKMSSRSSGRGAVSIAEVDVNGRYVRLKNNSDTEQRLGGWEVWRTYPNLRDISFHLPSSCVLAGGQTLTIWAEGAEAEADLTDLVLQGHRSWGARSDMKVVLLNPEHEEVAEGRMSSRSRGDRAELHLDEDLVASGGLQPFRTQPKKKKCCSLS
ncbi:lamin L3 isoform X2 [Antennarius striatus]|uniref:lamin L3 isoform X2 n=1 Tax=Antennarius striatus TaxID=241820 RepID=UPI0035B2716A